MGSFFTSCAVSGLEITDGDEMVMFLVNIPMNLFKDDKATSPLFFYNEFTQNFSAYYAYGKYNDYGTIAFSKKKGEKEHNQFVFEQWAKALKLESAKVVATELSGCNLMVISDIRKDAHSIHPMYIRRDIFEKLMYRYNFDQDRVVAFAKEFEKQIHEIVDQEYPDSLRISKIHPTLLLDELPILKEWWKTRYSGNYVQEPISAHSFALNYESSVISIFSVFASKDLLSSMVDKEEIDFPTHFIHIVKRDIITRVFEDLHKIWAPSLYAGQEQKELVAELLYKDFASIARNIAETKKDKFDDQMSEEEIIKSFGIRL